MDHRTKRRLVGTAVLVLLAVIFLPMLLSSPEPEEETVDVPLEVPPRSEAPDDPESFEVPDDFRTDDDADDAPDSDEAAGDEADDEADPEEVAEAPDDDAVQEDEVDEALEAVPEEGAYAAQVGSYSSEDNALSEQERLRGLGFAAYVEPLERDEGTLYRVRVGPVIDWDEAENLLQRLQDEADVSGYITRQQ